MKYVSPRRRRFAGVAAIAAAAALISACGTAGSTSSSTGSSSGPITIGASVPVSGQLAAFGEFVKWGYQHAVAQVNAQGGVMVAGKRRKINLVILDDQSDPNTDSSNVQQLISQDKASAILGSCTPALVNAGALISERKQIPEVTGCDPIESFTSVTHWTHVWDLFFHEPALAALPFQALAANTSATNKKVAILHDNGPDGLTVGGKIWPAMAKQFGYDVVLNQSFPTTATNFSTIVTQAKASGADVVLIDAATPQAVSIRKQMQSVNFTPKLLDIEKGAEPQQFATTLGKLSNGVLVGGYWDPSFPFPGASTLRQAFESQTHQTWSQHIADSYTAAQVLMDAITRAGSTDPTKLNTAISQTKKTYVTGPITFNAQHYAALPVVEDQWQNGQSKVVFSTNPKIKPDGTFAFPLQ